MMNGDTLEFDKLLHNYDYDNQKCLKTIEKENQLSEEIKKEIQMLEASITQLQETISTVDESVKHVHKQFTLNRDRCKSLKSTSSFLTEHASTMAKKLEALRSTCKHDESENQKMMDHYQNMWKDYEEKYHSFPFVKTLEDKMEELSLMETNLLEKEQEKRKLFWNNSIQDSSQVKELQKFIVALSQLKLDSIKKQEQISLLETQIQQKNIEKQEASMTVTVDSSLKEMDVNKENIQPDICLEPEEPSVPEKTEEQNQNKVINNYESLKISSNFESKMNVPSQHGNPSETYRGNSSISKTSEKTNDQSLCPDNVFKQPACNYADNRRNSTFNTKISLPPSLNFSNLVAPAERIRMPTMKTSIVEPVVTFPTPVARSTEKPNFTIPALQPPVMPNIMFNQPSLANCNQQNKDESANQMMTKPSISVDNSANVQVAQPLSHADNQVPKVVTSSLQFSSAPIQTPLSASDCNLISSTLTTSSKPSSLPASQEITQTPPADYKDNFYTVPLADGGRPFNLNEHQTFIKKFNFSPGAPSYTQRPMFELTEEKNKAEEVDDKKKKENPFFLQSFFTEKNNTPQNKENPDFFKAPTATVLSPFMDPFSGFNQSSGNENTDCALDFEFNNSAGEPSTSENFFSFNSNNDFFQPDDSAGGFSFNFNSTTNSDNNSNTFSLF